MPAHDRSLRVDRRPLFLCMTALVVLNVGFVQLTEAASLAWLVPLYVLALSSSLFARFKENLAYRSIWNLGILGFFKYFDFFITETATLLEAMGLSPSVTTLRILLPVGISFYTFQTLSYTIDIYRGQLEPAPRFTDFFLYVAFFPQLVAGPIVRARQLLPQLERRCTPSLQRIELGVYRIVQGLFLKMCVADVVAPAVGRAFDPDAIASLSTLAAWTGAVLFGVQELRRTDGGRWRGLASAWC